jgi:N-acetylglucosaminyl-diphospho-decaprenol L-rhamnosyltransferase
MPADSVPCAGDSSASPVLTIVFVNYNTTGMLRGALDSLFRHPPTYPVEVVVVDNASQPPPADGDWLSSANLRLVMNQENRGYGAAANQGIALARGRYVAIANTDIEFVDGTLDRLTSFLDRNPQAGIVAPQFLWPDLTPQPSARRYPSLEYVFSGRRSLLTRLFPNRRKTQEFLYAGIENSPAAVPVEVAIGAFLVAPRDLLRESGGFDESYFMFIEDVDLCQRVAQRGRGVFVLPQARMIHYGGAARAKATASMDFARLKSFYRYFRREPKLPRAVLLFLFSCYLVLLLTGRAMGIREWEYRAERIS